MITASESFSRDLQSLILKIVPGASGIVGLHRLSAGATLQTWSFDVVAGDRLLHPMILRRSPDGLRTSESVPLEVEAEVIRALARSGVPVAAVVHTLTQEDSLGEGFLMVRVDGETIPGKILRDPQFAQVRPRLAAQFGAILGAIHRVDIHRLPALDRKPGPVMVDRLFDRYESMGVTRPVFELAFRWLQDNAPTELTEFRLVHGDFRNGNMIVGAEGVRAVLDWESVHIGDPAEDLAWVCAPPWRFGQLDLPVGGLGSRDQLYEAYEAETGESVDRARVHWWEVLGSLRWGVSCAGMLDWFASGRDPTVERAMIAPRVSESELDLLRILTGSN